MLNRWSALMPLYYNLQSRGRKTGWSYIHIPASIAQQLKPGNKKSFRVKGKLDEYEIKGISLMPMGEGDFIMALKASLRKAIGKNKGAKLSVQLEADNNKLNPPAEFIECLRDEPDALSFYKQFPSLIKTTSPIGFGRQKQMLPGRRRIAQSVNALAKKFHFGQLLRSLKQDKEDFFR